MKILLTLICCISITCAVFSQAYTNFLVEKNNDDKISFHFSAKNFEDLALFHSHLSQELGERNVSQIVDTEFFLSQNLKYSDFLKYVYNSQIVYNNEDLDIAKKALSTYLLSASLNPSTPNIISKREPIENCMIEVDDTHILAENVNSCDDCSTDAISLPFTYNFCGSFYNELYINSNGNITFDTKYFVYNSIGIPNSSTAVMIAPFWADYDIRNCENQKVTYKIEDHRIIITYNEVGHYFNNCERTNTFQVVLTDGTDEYVGFGNNTAFYYGDMQWTTGDASYGKNGFGGTPATAGINKNDGMSYAVIGRFNLNNDVFDGPDGESDGVNYLDNKCFTFKSEDCNIDECIISNLQVLLDINCETNTDGLFAGDYVVDIFTSGGIGTLSVSGDLSSLNQTILTNEEVFDNTINVIVEDSLGCVSTANVAVEDCINPEPTCTDGFQNGSETGIDCGGDCPNECMPTCLNEPGLMQTSNSFVCGGRSIYLREAFSVMDENSVKAYVLHEGKVFDGINYITLQNSSRFYSPGESYHNKRLYISAIIGPMGNDGFPNLVNDCTVWTPYGAYVLFFDEVAVNLMDESCFKGRYFIDVQVNGGVGGISPNRAFKTVTDGKKTYYNKSVNDVLSFGPYARSGSYTIEASGAKGCNATLNSNYACFGLNRLLNYSVNSEIIKIAYLNEGLNIENIEVFNLKGQNIENQFSVDQHQAEVRISNKAKGLFVIKVLLSNNEFDYIKLLR